MNKILWGIAGLVLAITMSATAAYALFSSTVTIGGISIATGQADLQVGTTADDLHSGIFTPNLSLSGLFPGYDQQTSLYLKNASTAPIELDVTGRLASADGDWDTLKDVIEIRIMDANSHSSTGWDSLADWHTEDGMSLPGSNLAPGETRKYTVEMKVLEKYSDGSEVGNEIAGKNLSNITFVLTGTQD